MNTIQEKFSVSFDENENKIYVHYNGDEHSANEVLEE